SRDLALAAASAASTIALAYLGPHLIGGLLEFLHTSLSTLGDNPGRTISEGELSALVAASALQVAWLVGPLALVTTIAGVLMHGFQGGWSFAPGALRLNWSRLNPATGIKRFAPFTSGVETLKALTAFTAIGYFTWRAVQALVTDAQRLAWLSPG